jgi:hypothetical protein
MLDNDEFLAEAAEIAERKIGCFLGVLCGLCER